MDAWDEGYTDGYKDAAGAIKEMLAAQTDAPEEYVAGIRDALTVLEEEVAVPLLTPSW